MKIPSEVMVLKICKIHRPNYNFADLDRFPSCRLCHYLSITCMTVPHCSNFYHFIEIKALFPEYVHTKFIIKK
jgi:hypothetical protein